jgi:putative ABC transport system permease protein
MKPFRSFSRMISFGRNIVRRAHVEQDLSDEIACHLELLIASNLRDGGTEEEAQRAALLHLGGIEQVKEQVREARTGYFLETILHDLHCGAVFLLRSPSFSATAALTLACAFAASILVFCIARVGFLHPLNYSDADHLLQISVEPRLPDLSQEDVSLPRFELIRSSQKLLNVAAWAGEPVTATAMGNTEQVNVAHISSGFLELLNVMPLRGRLFSASENDTGDGEPIILSYRYWQERFGCDSAILGKRFLLDGLPRKVVGILPERFQAPFGRFDVFVPRLTDIRFLEPGQIQRGAGFLKVIARPNGKITMGQIQSAIAKIDREYRERASTNMDAHAASRIVPLRETIVRSLRPLFYSLIAGVVCVVVVATINVANLLLARLARRRKEIALRYALGASYGRVARQLATENIIIVLAATALALLLAWIGLNQVNAHASELLQGREAKLDGMAVCLAVALAFVTGSLFATISALHARYHGVSATLLNTSRIELGRPPLIRFRACLVVTQVALSLMLIVVAGLVSTSFSQLRKVDPGFDPEDVFVTQISPLFDRQTNNESVGTFYQKLIQRLKATPEIADAAAVYGLPLARDNTFLSYARADRPVSVVGERAVTWYRCVSPDYFSTMRIPLRRGRNFSTADNDNGPNVVILSETTARLLFGDADPIGRKIICGGTIQVTHTVIGVVGDVRSLDLALPVREEMYFSMFQRSEPSMRLIVRAASTKSNANGIESIIQMAVQEIDPNQAASATEPMNRLIARSVMRPRIVSFSLACFACLAVVVASVGIYSIVDCMVSERMREIGLRLALGAQRQNVFWLLIARGLKLVAVGLISGTIIAWSLAPLVSGLLFRVSATDPRIFASVFLLLGAVAFLASYLPARRAMAIAPIGALQCD